MKVILNLSYCINGIGWVKPGIEDELRLNASETAAQGLDRLFRTLDNWVTTRFPGAQLSNEPLAEKIIQLQDERPQPKIEPDEKILEQWKSGGAKMRQTIEAVYDVRGSMDAKDWDYYGGSI